MKLAQTVAAYCVLMVIVIALLNHQATAQSSLSFEFSPAEMRVAVGETVTNQIMLNNSQRLTGLTCIVEYDNRYLNLVDNGIKIGSAFDGLTEGIDYLQQIAIPNLMDETKVRLQVDVAFVANNAPEIGGPILEFTWQGKEAISDTTISINESLSRVVDINGVTVQPTVSPAIVDVIELPDDVTFQINLEGGKPTSSVKTQQGSHELLFRIGPTSFIVPENGSLTLTTPLPEEAVNISRPGYLTAYSANLQQTQPPYIVTLLAGDVNGDEAVNIFDLSQISARFGQPVVSDLPSFELEIINYSLSGESASKIDIFDLVVAARNFGRTGPIDIAQ